MGCHSLLQGIFPTKGSNLSLRYWQVNSLPLSHQTRSVALRKIHFTLSFLFPGLMCDGSSLPISLHANMLSQPLQQGDHCSLVLCFACQKVFNSKIYQNSCLSLLKTTESVFPKENRTSTDISLVCTPPIPRFLPSSVNYRA